MRIAAAVLFACCLASPVVQAGAPLELFQGTRHDSLHGLCFDGQRGLAVGSPGLLLESGDGGASWSTVEPFTGAALLDVSCTGESQLLVAQQGGIFRREGDRFQRVESGSDARLLGVGGNGRGLAFAVGGFGAVLRSADGGRSWEPLGFDWEAILDDFLEPHLYAVHVSAREVVTIVGEFGLVLRSTDGGDTWETVRRGEASLFGIDLREDGNGFAVGQGGTVLATRDGGATWSEVEVPSGANLLDVWSSPAGDVVVSGFRAVLRSSDDGASFELLEQGDLGVGWYQPVAAPAGEGQRVEGVLLAGHAGRIIRLALE